MGFSLIDCDNFLAKVLVTNEKLLEERKNAILKKIYEAESKLEKVKGEKANQIADKQNSEFLKRIDRTENIQRMQEITELKKAKMLDKIKRDYYRTEIIMYLRPFKR